MIATLPQLDEACPRERLVLVRVGGTDGDLLARLRTRYPDWVVTCYDGYLAGVAGLCREPARVVLADVESDWPHIHNAVAGLREALPQRGRLILCCRPEWEPLTRRLLDSGADDYLLHPLEDAELDAALGYERTGHSAPTSAVGISPGTEEIAAQLESLEAMAKSPRALLDQLASMIRRNLNARHARVVSEGAVATDGDDREPPVLSAAIRLSDRALGHVSIGPRCDGAYSTADVGRLEAYGRWCAEVLAAAAKQRHWRHLALTDECTGLGNRRFLQQRMRSLLERAARECLPVTLLLFDLDSFKNYNDAFGHEAGDEILRLTGSLFRQHCREQDIVTRYGGDEFAVVFWDPEGPRVAGSKHPDSALVILERIREALRAQRWTGLPAMGADVRLTISGGLATYPWAGTTLPALLRAADSALLAAKRAGKNRILLVGGEPESRPVP